MRPAPRAPTRPPLALAAVLLALWLTGAAHAAPPPTVYVSPDIPAQALDYDAENGLFLAHEGWLDGKLVHYYKFRVYAPANYDTDEGVERVPVVPLYLPTTDGGLTGIPAGQHPLLSHYPAVSDPEYSDFVRIHFVTVPANYAANTHHSAAGLLAAHPGEVAPSDIFANVPVVPNGAHLQHPDRTDRERTDPAAWAPIEPWIAWYDGDEVWTYVFETTSNDFADYANAATRTADSGLAGSGFESVTAPGFAGANGVGAIALWHLNQYTTGVTPGENNGGPLPDGQRNVVDLDRFDLGYSPLWQLYWVTQLPLGYAADDARDADVLGTPDEPANGFALTAMPVYINCPAIGTHGGTPVADTGADTFGLPDVTGLADVHLEGSLPMLADETVRLLVNGEELATETTGPLGAYTFTLDTSFLDRGDNTAVVMHAGEEVASFSVTRGTLPEASDAIVWVVVVSSLLVLVYGYSRMRRENRDGENVTSGQDDAPDENPAAGHPAAGDEDDA